MPKITFISAGNETREIDPEVGQSLMQAAKAAEIAEIEAECGGACACATCHVYIDAAWGERLDPKTPEEEAMLQFASNVEDSSRLSCQIEVTEAMDGLVVRTPMSQH